MPVRCEQYGRFVELAQRVFGVCRNSFVEGCKGTFGLLQGMLNLQSNIGLHPTYLMMRIFSDTSAQ